MAKFGDRSITAQVIIQIEYDCSHLEYVILFCLIVIVKTNRFITKYIDFVLTSLSDGVSKSGITTPNKGYSSLIRYNVRPHVDVPLSVRVPGVSSTSRFLGASLGSLVRVGVGVFLVGETQGVVGPVGPEVTVLALHLAWVVGCLVMHKF